MLGHRKHIMAEPHLRPQEKLRTRAARAGANVICSVHDQGSRSGWASAYAAGRIVVHDDFAKLCAEKAPIAPLVPLYSVDNKRAPVFGSRLLTEGL